MPNPTLPRSEAKIRRHVRRSFSPDGSLVRRRTTRQLNTTCAIPITQYAIRVYPPDACPPCVWRIWRACPPLARHAFWRACPPKAGRRICLPLRGRQANVTRPQAAEIADLPAACLPFVWWGGGAPHVIGQASPCFEHFHFGNLNLFRI